MTELWGTNPPLPAFDPSAGPPPDAAPIRFASNYRIAKDEAGNIHAEGGSLHAIVRPRDPETKAFMRRAIHKHLRTGETTTQTVLVLEMGSARVYIHENGTVILTDEDLYPNA